MSAAMWGGTRNQIVHGTPMGRPYPRKAQAETEGLGCISCCVGWTSKSNCTWHLGGVPVSKTAKGRPEGLGRIRRCVGRNCTFNHSRPPPRGVPIPRAAEVGQKGLGSIRRSVGRSWKFNRTRHPHVASLSPKRPRQHRRDSGVSAIVCRGTRVSIIPDPPHGASLFPQRPRQDRRDAGVSAAVWGGTGSSIIADPSPPGVPIPRAALSELEGLGRMRRCVGRS